MAVTAIIIPRTASLSFNMGLSLTADLKRALVSNINRAIVKKLAVKFEINEILGVDDFDVFACHRDLRKTQSEKRSSVRQGIIHSRGFNENCMKL